MLLSFKDKIQMYEMVNNDYEREAATQKPRLVHCMGDDGQK